MFTVELPGGLIAMSTILIVDDEAGVRASLGGVLRDEGYTRGRRRQRRGLSRAGGAAGLRRHPARHLAARHRRARRRSSGCASGASDAQVIMISGHASIESAVRATKLGAFDFIEKPLSLEKTVLAVRNALRQRRLEVENRALRARVDRRYAIVGESAAMRAAARADRHGGAHQRPRARVGRERHRQGAGRAADPRAQPPHAPGRSSRSTARRFPRS